MNYLFSFKKDILIEHKKHGGLLIYHMEEKNIILLQD